ncbi:hypothetical protein EQV96_07080 [Pseudomonas sp. TMW22080]|nr:hypothetical protein [Pseudomonas sp. TMW22080]
MLNSTHSRLRARRNTATHRGSGLARDAGADFFQLHRCDPIASKPAPTGQTQKNRPKPVFLLRQAIRTGRSAGRPGSARCPALPCNRRQPR